MSPWRPERERRGRQGWSGPSQRREGWSGPGIAFRSPEGPGAKNRMCVAFGSSQQRLTKQLLSSSTEEPVRGRCEKDRGKKWGEHLDDKDNEDVDNSSRHLT